MATEDRVLMQMADVRRMVDHLDSQFVNVMVQSGFLTEFPAESVLSAAKAAINMIESRYMMECAQADDESQA